MNGIDHGKDPRAWPMGWCTAGKGWTLWVQYIRLCKLPATGLQGHITAEVMVSESDGSV